MLAAAKQPVAQPIAQQPKKKQLSIAPSFHPNKSAVKRHSVLRNAISVQWFSAFVCTLFQSQGVLQWGFETGGRGVTPSLASQSPASMTPSPQPPSTPSLASSPAAPPAAPNYPVFPDTRRTPRAPKPLPLFPAPHQSSTLPIMLHARTRHSASPIPVWRPDVSSEGHYWTQTSFTGAGRCHGGTGGRQGTCMCTPESGPGP